MEEGDSSQHEYTFDDIPEEIESGSKLKFVKEKDIWYWLPFNILYQERINEFKTMLDAEDISFEEILKDCNYTLNHIKALKRIYQSLTKDKETGYGTAINLNSLQMLSYPASPDYCTDYVGIVV